MTNQQPTPDPTLQAILDQLQALGSRIERLEHKAGLAPQPPTTSTPPPTPPVQPTPPAVQPALPAELRGRATAVQPGAPIHTQTPPPPPPPAQPTAPIVSIPATPAHKVEAYHSLSGHAAVSPSAAAPAQRPAPSPDPWSAVPAAPAKKLNLEWIIGTKGLAAAGALAVVIGVIFFLKYAVDQGWIAHLPPLVRCLFGVAFGGALVGAGEAARRRINSLAGAGLYAAGIACAYASTYAGYGYFDPPVIAQPVAFVALALISAVGIALSAKTRLVAVAIVSLVGAYLAPFLMVTEHPNPLVFPVYAGALLATGLVLSAWLRGGFRWVGRAVWWATMLLGGGWGIETLDTSPLIVMGFAVCVWVMVHAAHVVAARGQAVSDAQRDGPMPTPSLRGSGPMLSSFSVTAWATVLLTLALRQINPSIDWLAPCGMTAVTGAMAVWLAGHLGVVRNLPRNDSERLGASLALQSASALIGTVALATTSAGPAAALLWLCMGLGAIFAGKWARALPVMIYGELLMCIGTGRLVLYDSWHSSLFTPTLDFAGLTLSPWTAWAAGAAVIWLAAGWVISLGMIESRRSVWGGLTAAVGVLLLIASLGHQQTNSHSFTWAMLALCVLLVGLHTLRRQLALHIDALVLLTLTTAKIASVDALTGRVPSGSPTLLGLPLTPSLWLCIGAAAAWAVLTLAARSTIGRHPRGLPRAIACATVTVVMLLLAPVTQDMVFVHLVWPWAIVAVLASLASKFDDRLNLRIGATVAAFLAAAAWLVAWVVAPGFTHWSTAFPVLLHPGLLAAVAVGGGLMAVAKVSSPIRDGSGKRVDESLPLVCTIAAGAMLWLATSFEASRIAEMTTGSVAARGAAVSIWWGLLAVALLYVGFRRSIPGLRYTGLALLGMAGVKVVLLDMAGAPQLARVAGFVTLGLLMLGTAVGYARVAKTLEGAKPKPESKPGDVPPG